MSYNLHALGEKGYTTMREYYISDEVLKKIYGFLVAIKGIYTKNRRKIRIFGEAVYCLFCIKCQTRLLFKEYGNCFSVYQKFLRWKKFGI
jgi:hypothetical protein